MCPYIHIFGKSFFTMDVINFIGVFFIIWLGWIRRKMYGYGRIQQSIINILVFVVGMTGAFLFGQLINLCFSKYYESVSQNVKIHIYGAILIIPIVILLLSIPFRKSTKDYLYIGNKKLFKIKDKFNADPLSMLDFVTPSLFIFFTIAKIGCICAGCCFGIPSDFGIMNEELGVKTFPVQITEAISTVIVVAITLIVEKKGKLAKGSLFPLTTITYMIQRFIWEYFRYYKVMEEKHYFMGMTVWQTYAVVFSIVSIIVLIILNHGKREAGK